MDLSQKSNQGSQKSQLSTFNNNPNTPGNIPKWTPCTLCNFLRKEAHLAASCVSKCDLPFLTATFF